MNATRELPAGYTLKTAFDLSRSQRLMLAVNALGLLLLGVAVALFTSLLALLRPDEAGQVFDIAVNSVPDLVTILAALLLVTVVMVLVHEGLHGLFFWLVAGAKPRYGFRGMYAFAAAPEWYIPRNRYLWVGLAPLVIISGVGTALMAVAPVGLLRLLYLLLVFNFSGAVGDLMVVFWLLRQPASILAQDYGDGVRVFAPGQL
jgi:hypothetical protein